MQACSKLTPILDGDGLLRMTGRLKNSLIPSKTKQLILLPPQSRLAHLLVQQTHMVTPHGGPQLVIGYLRNTYWINRLRQMAKGIIHRCVTRLKYVCVASEPLMGQLPSERVTRGEPFARTGVDFAGPFIISRIIGRPTRGAARPTEKAWIRIFGKH